MCKRQIPKINLEQNNGDNYGRPKLDNQINKNQQTKDYINNATYIDRVRLKNDLVENIPSNNTLHIFTPFIYMANGTRTVYI